MSTCDASDEFEFEVLSGADLVDVSCHKSLSKDGFEKRVLIGQGSGSDRMYVAFGMTTLEKILEELRQRGVKI